VENNKQLEAQYTVEVENNKQLEAQYTVEAENNKQLQSKNKQQIEQLSYWLECIDYDFQATINSWRWKVGHNIIKWVEKILGRKNIKLTADHIVLIIEEYQQWKQQSFKNINSIHLSQSYQVEKLTQPSDKKKIIEAVKETKDSVEMSNSYISLSRLKEYTHSSSIKLNISHLNDAINSTIINQQLDALSQIVTIIIPIYNAYDSINKCLASIFSQTTIPYQLLLIDDCSTDSRIQKLLTLHQQKKQVTILYNQTNQGYVKTVNIGIEQTQNDVILLNSDTIVTTRWLQKLISAAYSASDIATVTPFSNAAGAFSVPECGVNKELPIRFTNDDMGRIVERSSENSYPVVPTGNGFCLYIKRSVFDDIGVFDAEKFEKGYGEENDFCLRAEQQGWKNIIDDSTFIYHERSASFGESKNELIKKNRAVLDILHPNYSAAVKKFINSTQIAHIRKNIQLTQIAVDKLNNRIPQRILYVLHEGSGGTPETNRDLTDALSNQYEPFILTSTLKHIIIRTKINNEYKMIHQYTLSQALKGDDFYSQELRGIYFDVLLRLKIEMVHIRHLFKHSFDLPKIAKKLGLPVTLSFHDFFFVCPSINLINDKMLFCNADCSNVKGNCNIPADQHQHLPKLKNYLPIWKQHVSQLFQFCDNFITTSNSAKEVLIKIYPELKQRRFRVIEHGRDFPCRYHYAQLPSKSSKVKILIPGNIDYHKGLAFILQLYKADYKGILEFHFLGRIPQQLEAVGIYHGTYTRNDFHQQVKKIRPSFVGIFSIWGETYCHTLTEGLACGVPILTLKVGTTEERLNQLKAGWFLNHHNIDEAVSTLYQIIDNKEHYQKTLDIVNLLHFKSTQTMADEYEHEYKIALALHKKMDEPKKILIFSPMSQSGFNGSSYIRVLLPLSHPCIAEKISPYYIDYINVSTQKIALQLEKMDFDGILVQRNGLPASLIRLVIKLCNHRKKTLIFEIDDDLFSIHQEHSDYYKIQTILPQIEPLVSSAKKIIVSTPQLKKVMHHKHDNISLIRNVIDEKIWFSGSDYNCTMNQSDKLVIGYMGTYTHDKDLAIIMKIIPEIQHFLKKQNISLEFQIIGGTKNKMLPCQSVKIPAEATVYPKFVQFMKRTVKWDIAVAPLLNNDLNCSKSELKFLEYTALGAVGIYSNIGAYADIIEEGKTGLLCDIDDEQAWKDNIIKLCVNKTLRYDLYKNALNKVNSSYLLKNNTQNWLTIFN
jgi:GT2 family glycosyltransferase